MKITSVLLKPNLIEIENQFLRLVTLLGGHESDEARDLILYIEKQLACVREAKAALLSLEDNPENNLSFELFEDFREMKLCQRFAERRWRLILSNKVRNRKMRERTSRVASIAA